MTEAEWQVADEPHAMLSFLKASGNVSGRKHRLFAVACSRRIWDRIDEPGRKAVATAEEFADGKIDADAMRTARLACQGAGGQSAWYAAATIPEVAARNAARSAQAGVATNPWLNSEKAELSAQANLLRDIYGPLPFRLVTLERERLSPAVLQLAEAIYQGRAFNRMEELALVLAESGCDNQEILYHCRQPGFHVRGCFVVDIILDRV